MTRLENTLAVEMKRLLETKDPPAPDWFFVQLLCIAGHKSPPLALRRSVHISNSLHLNPIPIKPPRQSLHCTTPIDSDSYPYNYTDLHLHKMQHSFTLAASLLTLLPTVLAAGTARVVNNCGTDVWYASVAQSVHASMQKLPPGGYSESFSKANVGVSIKLAATQGGAVTQFEFTWDSPTVAYDISNIDGNPFAQQGMSLVPSMVGAAGYPSCVVVDCPAGQDRCDAAYNLPDDVRTKVCPEDSDLTFTLCPGGAVAPAPPAAPSSTSAKASVSVPASTAGSAPSAPAFSKSAAASASPTSFITYTTPAAKSSVVASSQVQAPPAAPSSVVQSPQDPAPSPAPATTPAAQSPAPAQTYNWNRGGGWGGHYHTKRAHIHHQHHS